MLNNLKHFGKKITLLVTILVTFAVICITLLSFYINRSTVKENFLKNVEQHNQNFVSKIKEEISDLQSEIEHIEGKKRLFNTPFIQINGHINNQDSSRNKYLELCSYFRKEIFNELANMNEVEDIYMLNTTIPEPIIVFQYNTKDTDNDIKKFKNIDNIGVNVHVKSANINQPVLESGRFFTYISQPIYVEDILYGMIILKIDLTKIAKKIEIGDNTLNKTRIVNEVLKLEKRNIFKVYTSLDSTTTLYEETEDILYPKIIERWMKVPNFYDDFNIKNTNQINYWTYDKELGICLLTKVQIGLNEYNHGNFNYITLIIGLGIIGISFIISLYFSRILSFPIIKLKKVLRLVSKGVLPQKMNTPLNDEVGEMITTVNKIVSSLKKTAEYAQKIGHGEFDSEFKPLSKQDILGMQIQKTLLETGL